MAKTSERSRHIWAGQRLQEGADDAKLHGCCHDVERFQAAANREFSLADRSPMPTPEEKAADEAEIARSRQATEDFERNYIGH